MNQYGHIVDEKIVTVHELLASIDYVAIPAYQRPYKWGLKNVSDLFGDVSRNLDKSAYRLGAIVFESSEIKDGKKFLNIVDGQQRTLTLLLVVWAIIELRAKNLIRPDLRDRLNQLRAGIKAFMTRQIFPSSISQFNLKQNYQEIARQVDRPNFDEKHIEFFLNNCELVTFVLGEVSEAFQFFDSQNARGRDLAPHDLLKAYHLREFPKYESDLQARSVSHWEGLDSEKLSSLFSTYLYRIRKWSEGNSARIFGKGDVDLFKGVNLDRVGFFPYVESLRITHHFVDDYNQQFQRKIDGRFMHFPFHLDQMIINGRRFFEMAEHYARLVAEIIKVEECDSEAESSIPFMCGEPLSERAATILRTLNYYKQRVRTGDKYVRSMFDCALAFYIDKFGAKNLSGAIEKCFVWAYGCRIKQQVVQLATMDNYVLENNLIRAIRDARLPEDVLSFPVPTISKSENKNKQKEDALLELFKEMKYYE